MLSGLVRVWSGAAPLAYLSGRVEAVQVGDVTDGVVDCSATERSRVGTGVPSTDEDGAPWRRRALSQVKGAIQEGSAAVITPAMAIPQQDHLRDSSRSHLGGRCGV